MGRRPQPVLQTQILVGYSIWDALKPAPTVFLQQANDSSLCDEFRYRAERALQDQ